MFERLKIPGRTCPTAGHLLAPGHYHVGDSGDYLEAGSELAGGADRAYRRCCIGRLVHVSLSRWCGRRWRPGAGYAGKGSRLPSGIHNTAATASKAAAARRPPGAAGIPVVFMSQVASIGVAPPTTPSPRL